MDALKKTTEEKKIFNPSLYSAQLSKLAILELQWLKNSRVK